MCITYKRCHVVLRTSKGERKKKKRTWSWSFKDDQILKNIRDHFYPHKRFEYDDKDDDGGDGDNDNDNDGDADDYDGGNVDDGDK